MREWREDDAEAMHRWIGNPEVMQHLTWGTCSFSETQDYLNSLISRQCLEPRREYFLAIETGTAGRVIGDAGFTWVSSGTAEIGYFLEPCQWGKGQGLEAARLIIDIAVELGAHTVAATCFKDNWRSERIMQTCGMTRQPNADPHVLKYALSAHSNAASRERLTPSP